MTRRWVSPTGYKIQQVGEMRFEVELNFESVVYVIDLLIKFLLQLDFGQVRLRRLMRVQGFPLPDVCCCRFAFT